MRGPARLCIRLLQAAQSALSCLRGCGRGSQARSEAPVRGEANIYDNGLDSRRLKRGRRCGLGDAETISGSQNIFQRNARSSLRLQQCPGKNKPSRDASHFRPPAPPMLWSSPHCSAASRS